MAKNNIVGSLDTNVLLRLLLDDVVSHTQTVQKLFTKGRRFEIADAAIIEMVFVLEKVYGFTREAVSESVLAVTRNEQFVCNATLFEKVVPMYIACKQVSIVDCCLLVYAQLNEATSLYTFDRDLVKYSEGSAQMIE